MRPNDAEIARRLHTILRGEAFKPDRTQGFWDHLSDWLHRADHWLGKLGEVPRLILLGVCVVTLLALVAHVWRLAQDARHALPDDATHPTAQSAAGATPETLLERAHGLAESGALREAARALQQAVFMHLCRARQEPWRDSTADWEWLQLLHPAEDVVAFTRAAQQVAFGPSPTRSEFDQCQRTARELVRARSAA